MSHRHRHHARSTSYPESINLSLLSFSRSLSTVPSLSSGSIIASLSSVSFPDRAPTPGSITPPNIIPLKDNILTLSPPSYFNPTDSLSSNEGRRQTRITIAAPTSPRIKQIKEEPGCVTKWVGTLSRLACPPGHIPWAGAKATRELDWIPEGSMFPPNLYSKVISDIRSRVLRSDVSQASTRIASPPQAHARLEDRKEHTTQVIPPRPLKQPSAGSRIPCPVARGNAASQTHANTKLLQTASPHNSKRAPERRRPVPIIPQGAVPHQKVLHPNQLSAARAHIPTTHTQPRRRRTSIPTSDMINTLRVQMATLSANTPPPDQSSHNITSTTDYDASILPASYPPSRKFQASSAASQIGRTPKADVTVNKPYPTEDDFGTRLSSPYTLAMPTTSTSRQSNVAKLAPRPTFHPRAHPGPRRNRDPTSTSSVSSVSTSYSDDFTPGARTARGVTTRMATRRHGAPRTQIFVPRKLPPLFGLPARSAAYGKVDGDKRNAPQLSAHGSLPPIMILKMPFKEVRFAPLPTTIRRYPPEPSEPSEDEAAFSTEEIEWVRGTGAQRVRKPVPAHRSLPRSPWVPDLSGNAMDLYSGDPWNFGNTSSRYPPIAREPLSMKHLDIKLVPTAKPMLTASSAKFSSSACNPLLPLIRLSESESTPNSVLPSSSSMVEANSPRKYSFTRRSLSRIIPSSIRESNRPGSVGVPTLPSQRSMMDESSTCRERGVAKEGEATSAVRSRLPRLRLGSIFSRLKQ